MYLVYEMLYNVVMWRCGAVALWHSTGHRAEKDKGYMNELKFLMAGMAAF